MTGSPPASLCNNPLHRIAAAKPTPRFRRDRVLPLDAGRFRLPEGTTFNDFAMVVKVIDMLEFNGEEQHKNTTEPLMPPNTHAIYSSLG
ncbi:hypothetical protein [Rhodopirellula sp. P2]|uniref:hypothetical protein n=1 Tax=Rhodopirellula sp. P2 TaxID=2127060 RepID=UPI00236881BF|nr:hypothetical protein [Rhodopirellula sp. P2]WDQ15139.1 hypothetical protein PSR62_16000 [Rhodopirellula sp. P2]